MKLPSRQPATFLAGQEISHLLWKPKLHYSFYKGAKSEVLCDITEHAAVLRKAVVSPLPNLHVGGLLATALHIFMPSPPPEWGLKSLVTPEGRVSAFYSKERCHALEHRLSAYFVCLDSERWSWVINYTRSVWVPAVTLPSIRSVSTRIKATFQWSTLQSSFSTTSVSRCCPAGIDIDPFRWRSPDVENCFVIPHPRSLLRFKTFKKQQQN
jgi:hypothetical protein